MKVIKNEAPLFVDVDETLIVSTDKAALKTRPVYDKATAGFIMVQPHANHVKLLIDEKARGRFIIVWSKGGHAWAEAVCISLGLVGVVDQVMTKPTAYVDDKEVSTWLTERIFIPHELEYKT